MALWPSEPRPSRASHAADFELRTRGRSSPKTKSYSPRSRRKGPVWKRSWSMLAIILNVSTAGRHGRHPRAGPRQPRGDLPRGGGQAEIAREQHRRRRAPGARQRVADPRVGDPARAKPQDPGQFPCPRRAGPRPPSWSLRFRNVPRSPCKTRWNNRRRNSARSPEPELHAYPRRYRGSSAAGRSSSDRPWKRASLS